MVFVWSVEPSALYMLHPTGWEPVTEMDPHVDENLIAAIEKLGGKNLVFIVISD